MKLDANLESVGLDWLRITSDYAPIGATWLEKFKTFTRPANAADLIDVKGRRLGYAGYTAPQAFWGQRADGWMIDLSGETARYFGPTMLKEGGRVSRVDIQITRREQGHVKALIQHAYADACAFPYSQGLPPDVEMRLGRHGPRSLVIGKRSSDFYARIYDKFEQSRETEYEDCIRYEIEIKGHQAHIAGEEFRAIGCDLKYLQAYVIAWFANHGVTVPGNTSVEPTMKRYHRPATNLDSKRAWLRKQVAPTAAKVVEVIGLVPLFNDIMSASPDSQALKEVIQQTSNDWES